MTLLSDKPETRVITEASEEDMIAGEPLTLTCTVDAKPSADAVNWHHDGNVVVASSEHTLSDDGLTLTIMSLKRESDGEYECAAESTVGVAVKMVPYVLKVLCK